MNANELMIGDWVVYRGDAEYTNPVRIEGMDILTNALITEDREDVGFDGIDPIPLTAEILEKNGFKFDGSGQRSMMLISEPHFSEGIRYNIYVGLKKKTIEVFVAHPVEKSPNWRKSNKVYLEVCGLYVHELQHALRLCGIEKEIEL